ncbi:cell division protein FtsQ/DivIB, partial [Cellulomonas shaoxiangyii]
ARDAAAPPSRPVRAAPADAAAARPPRTGPVPTTTGGTSRAVPGPTTATGPTRNVTTYTVGGRFSGPVRPAVVSTTSRERFAERARARRALAHRQVLLIAAGVLVAGGLGWLLLLSPVLALDPAEVEVAGAGTVVAVDQVLAVVAQHHGTPLPRLDTVRLRDDVLEVPGVREARVVREWPRGVAVQLVSREPVAAVPEATAPDAPASDGAPGFALLDQEGVQVGRAEAPPAGLPVVDVPVGDERTLTAVLHVLEQLPPDLLAQVEGVSAKTRDTVAMQLRDGPRVEWGSADETPLKVAVLAALRAAPVAAGAVVYDVSAPRMPITR